MDNNQSPIRNLSFLQFVEQINEKSKLSKKLAEDKTKKAK